MRLTLVIIYITLLFCIIAAAKPKSKKSHLKAPPRLKGKRQTKRVPKKSTKKWIRGRSVPYIGGGIYHTTTHDVPFVVGLVRLYQNFHQYFCAGTILNNYAVITSITCARNITDEEQLLGKVVVRSGTAWIEGTGGFDHPIGSILHDKFVSIMHVKNPFKYAEYENFVSLVASKLYTYNRSSEAEVLGWGESVYLGSTSERLSSAKVQLLSNDECGEAYPSITSDLICASSLTAYFCDADSGGPLIQDNVLIGVALHSADHCRMGVPGVYLRMSEIFGRITSTLGGISFSPPLPEPEPHLKF